MMTNNLDNFNNIFQKTSKQSYVERFQMAVKNFEEYITEEKEQQIKERKK